MGGAQERAGYQSLWDFSPACTVVSDSDSCSLGGVGEFDFRDSPNSRWMRALNREFRSSRTRGSFVFPACMLSEKKFSKAAFDTSSKSLNSSPSSGNDTPEAWLLCSGAVCDIVYLGLAKYLELKIKMNDVRWWQIDVNASEETDTFEDVLFILYMVHKKLTIKRSTTRPLFVKGSSNSPTIPIERIFAGLYRKLYIRQIDIGQ